MSIFIEDYTPKSFVVRGDTRECKESLKSLGGKWNSSLTDKDSGDKFGAWLFWSDKRKELDSWIERGCPNVENSQCIPTSSKSSFTSEGNIKSLEAKVDALTKMVENLCRYHQIESGKPRGKVAEFVNSDVESDDDVPVVKPKRLLRK